MRLLTLAGCSERKQAYRAAQDENKVCFVLKKGGRGKLGVLFGKISDFSGDAKNELEIFRNKNYENRLWWGQPDLRETSGPLSYTVYGI